MRLNQFNVIGGHSLQCLYHLDNLKNLVLYFLGLLLKKSTEVIFEFYNFSDSWLHA